MRPFWGFLANKIDFVRNKIPFLGINHFYYENPAPLGATC